MTGVEPVLRTVVTFIMAGAGTISLGGFVAFVRGQLQGLELRTRVVPGATLSLSWYDDNFYELALNVVDERSCRWMISHNGPLGLSDWRHQWLCEVRSRAARG